MAHVTAKASPPATGRGRSQRNASNESPARRFAQRTEPARDRDVHRYLHPWASIHQPAALYRSAFPFDADEPAPAPEPCPDTALAAFAQLCALRMHARRCFVTLISFNVEYVLVEATRTMSFQYGWVESQKDEAWIGTSSFLRSEGINGEALEQWRQARSLREMPIDSEFYYTEGVSPHWCIVSDLRTAAAHQDKTFVQQAEWARFYVSVPLRSSQGSVIGSVTVMDDKPRFGLSANEMCFMEDLSDTVVEHLDATLVRAQRQRSERLIQGLGLFNAGKDTLRDWWLRQEDNRVENKGRHFQAGKEDGTERKARADREFGTRSAPHDTSKTPSRTPPESDHESRKSSCSSHNSAHAAKDATSQPAAVDRAPGTRDIADTGDDIERSIAIQVNPGVAPTRLAGSAELPPHEGKQGMPHQSAIRRAGTSPAFDLPKACEKAYARASNLIREAVGADEVILVDANTVASSAASQRRHGTSKVDSRSASPGSGPGVDLQSSNSSETESSDSASGGSSARLCKVHGLSTRSKWPGSGEEASGQKFGIHERYLARLVRRYPNGRVFNFDEQGQAASSSGEDTVSSATSEGPGGKTKNRVGDKQRLSRMMDGAKSIAFYPLRDEGHDRWRSCIFVWSKAKDRFFDPVEDLTYLSAFGHSLVAELSRLETLAADRAKANFISSISHELRSPLHGILAGVELLQESDLSEFQQEMIYTITMAGRTLLDTVNHILDHSKISKFTRAQRSQGVTSEILAQRGFISDIAKDSAQMEPSLDLAKVTEEVIESVVSAYRYEHYSVYSHSMKTSVPPNISIQDIERKNKQPPDRDELSIALNISWKDSWTTTVLPGSWTRILTKLVGNALKYTQKGLISIQLDSKELPDAKGTSTSLVRLIVEDTGIGIAKDFLDGDLYTAFKQENSNTSGTGLGLSIVKQLVQELGGTIKITSKLGTGTKVVVTFQATFDTRRTSSGLSFDPTEIGVATEKLNVDRFQLLDLHVPGGPNGHPVATRDTHDVLSSVIDLGKNWIGCETSYSTPRLNGEEISVCAIMEHDLITLAKHEPQRLYDALQALSAQHSHILILAQYVRSVSLGVSWDDKLNIRPVFVHQPIGPRKLIRAIATDHNSSVVLSPSSESTIGSHPHESIKIESQQPQFTHMPSSATDSYFTLSKHTLPEVAESSMTAVGHNSGAESTSSLTRSKTSISRGVSSEDICLTNDTPLTSKSVSTGAVEVDSHRGSTVNHIGNSPRSEKVLLVEDNEVNMKLLVTLMKKLHVEFDCAINGRDACGNYRRHHTQYFLVLMDMSMPIMDGFAATANIRETERERHIGRCPIIALTGVTSAEAKKRAFDCGVDEFYSKPVNIKELRALVARHRPAT